MRLINRKLGLIVSLFLISGSSFASSIYAQKFQKFVNEMQTFSASFEQVQPDEARFQLNESKGYFKLNRPGKLLWAYEKPDPQEILVDSLNIWVFDKDLDQVTIHDLANVKNDLPLSWLLFEEPVEQRFKILYGGKNGELEWFNLEPKQATFFQSLDIAMQDGKMVEVHMYQNEENVTKVRFNNIVLNEPMSDSQFQFQVPDGVDVIGQPIVP